MSAQHSIIAGDDRLVIIRANEITMKRMAWLWPGRIPLGAITTFAGLPGEGKSLVVADIVARITTNQPFPDGPNPLAEPAEVLIVVAEDDPATALRPRLEAAGADCSKVHFLVAAKDSLYPKQPRTVLLGKDAQEIKQYLKDHPAIRLVVLDPVTENLDDHGTKTIDDVRARGLLRPIVTKGVAVLLVAHFNKKENLSAIHRVGGAGAFVAMARASSIFATDCETKQRQMLPLKNNYTTRANPGLTFDLEEVPVVIGEHAEMIPRVKWIGTTDKSADDVLDKEEARADALSVATEFLKDILADGRKLAEDVKKAAMAKGISKATLRRAKDKLKVLVEKEQVVKGPWFWSLPM